MKQSLKLKNNQQGFSFLESLLALFVLTIGLLGVAAMHGQSMRTGYVAVQRMKVVNKGEEILERMRANPQGLEGYAGAGASYGCSSGSTCLPTDMAADDLFIWLAEVNAMFPGTPVVDIREEKLDLADDPSQMIRAITVSIDWSVRNTNYNYTVNTEITCTADTCKPAVP
ncbi:MAG: type IV pilus modification protein PilV [Gammaproteobacteria bacterium]|nr:type IV pilus modification protein PilV [Gammaproteobacteria bacterium]